MIIPKYWAKEERIFEVSRRKNIQLVRWGWSDRSQEEARSMASERMQSVAAKVLAGANLERYPYGRGPLREEVIQVVAGIQRENLAVVTRNAYGALVLNTAGAMFMDVDLPPVKSDAGPGKFFRRLFGGGEKPFENPELPALKKIEEWAGRQTGLTLRIYRTAAGFRCLIISHVYDPAGDQTREMMTSLGCDPLYIKLCREQGSFRARLTPKPWRIHIENPSWRWPFRDDREQRKARKWQEKYQNASSAYGVCRLIKTTGGAGIHPEIAPVLNLHDRMCCSRDDRKLA